MLFPSPGMRVYLALGNTDMRKSINGLSILVESNMELDPFSGHLFVFCNRRRNILKILYWDRNGFCLWHKRLEKHRFRWPESESEVLKIGHRELMWLIDGLEIDQQKAHKSLSYSILCWYLVVNKKIMIFYKKCYDFLLYCAMLAPWSQQHKNFRITLKISKK